MIAEKKRAAAGIIYHRKVRIHIRRDKVHASISDELDGK